MYFDRDEKLTDELKDAGREGWALATVVPYKVGYAWCFTRPL